MFKIFLTVIFLTLPEIVSAGVISDAPRVVDLAMSALRFVLSVVSVVAIIGILVAGVFYMTAAGDTARTARAKGALIGSIIGLAIALLALVIISALVGIAQ